jgi:hypothetical protein
MMGFNSWYSGGLPYKIGAARILTRENLREIIRLINNKKIIF